MDLAARGSHRDMGSLVENSNSKQIPNHRKPIVDARKDRVDMSSKIQAVHHDGVRVFHRTCNRQCLSELRAAFAKLVLSPPYGLARFAQTVKVRPSQWDSCWKLF